MGPQYFWEASFYTNEFLFCLFRILKPELCSPKSRNCLKFLRLLLTWKMHFIENLGFLKSLDPGGNIPDSYLDRPSDYSLIQKALNIPFVLSSYVVDNFHWTSISFPFFSMSVSFYISSFFSKSHALFLVSLNSTSHGHNNTLHWMLRILKNIAPTWLNNLFFVFFLIKFFYNLRYNYILIIVFNRSFH